MSKIVSKLIIFFVYISLLSLQNAEAQSAQQIEQFKKLPKSQQQQLAKQLGIDISGISNGSDLRDKNVETDVYPRGTRFDQQGNPIDDQDEYPLADSDEEEELKLYGQSLFANAPSTFSPASNTPVPANYIIGPGDELVVQLYGKENEEYRLTVGRDGNIIIPKLGPISIATMSFSEAKTYLAEQIKKQIIGVELSLTMGELRSMRIFVMGEAHKPGAYSVSSLSTITHALFVSGGVSDIASLRNIQLKRAGKLVATLDLYDLLNSGDTRNDVLLQPSDAIFIPSIERTVSIDGEVRRPAIYELKNEETLTDVMKLAGGKLAEGYEGAVNVRRFINGEQIQLTVDLKHEDINVVDGDQIVISKISSFVSNSITLIGAVARPGKYQWKENLRISEFLGNRQKDLLEIADLTYVLIVRDINENRDIELLQIDLSELDINDPTSNVELKANDRVLVFSKIEGDVLGDLRLADLAFTKDELDLKEKELWQKRIEDRLFWESVGLVDEENIGLDLSDAKKDKQTLPIITLTEAEREKVLEFKDTNYYSRKRMLSPVIVKLREQAKHGKPLQLIEIAGEVKVPGVYPLTKNASVNSLIKAAGGLTESSYLMKSEITRTTVSEKGVAEINHIRFNPGDVLDGNVSDVALISKDRVNIFAIPSWQQELKVTVKGEVEFPGEYTIRRGETLSDLLSRVGNLTQYGDPNAAIFTRESLKIQERNNLRKLAEDLRKQVASEGLRTSAGAGSVVNYDEAKKLLNDLTKVDAVGRLVIDLQSLLKGDAIVNVLLEDGDTLYVPSQSQSINVIGEVYVPTSHLFSAGLSYEDYISKSGGMKNLADEDRIYIIRSNGSVELPGKGNDFWFSSNGENVGIMPGDTIVVPFDSDNIDNLTLWSSATQIIYQLAVAVAAIGSL
ncbi:SLBB domain-containing protein [uncultured Paraglaciecola sp.]|uniref:SLBB domain-containing protein n=1 Tax=uncultured Paraglaciecola sp. TaxID=1765024 RepID=UPI0025F05673|nr:SLBB domain-containing protein [uncultured Paraglaciecola sp.]